jgi:hypothetical protein
MKVKGVSSLMLRKEEAELLTCILEVEYGIDELAKQILDNELS